LPLPLDLLFASQTKSIKPLVGPIWTPILKLRQPKGLPFRLTDYLELLDWTGRILRENKRGAIDVNLPPILEYLQIEPKQWLFLARHFRVPVQEPGRDLF